MLTAATLRRAAKPRMSLEVAIPLVVLVLALSIPMLLLVSTAFNVGDPQAFPATEFGLASFREVADHLDWIANSLIIAGCGTAIAIVMAVILSWALNRTNIPNRKLLSVLIAIPYPLGPLVGALAWQQLGSPSNGMLNALFNWATGTDFPIINTSSLTGIVIVTALFEAPVATLMIGAAMKRMDPALEESAAMNGSGTFHTAMTITLPLMLPAILSAALFLFVSMTGAFAIPAILGAEERIYVATTAIYHLFSGYPPNYPLAAALGFILVAIASVALWLHSMVLRGRTHEIIGGKNYRPRPIKLRRGSKIVLSSMLWLYVIAAVALPIGTLLLASLQKTSALSFDPALWTLENFHFVAIEFPTTRQAIINSLILATATGGICAILAAGLAWIVYRTKSAGRGALEQAIMLPQAVPHIIFAVGFLWTVLLLPIPLYNTVFAILLAFIVLFLPLAFRTMSGVVVQLSKALEEASYVCGASRARTFASITVPLLSTGVLSTWVLLFMISVREVSASIFLAGSDSQVLGPAILSFWDSGGMPRVSALAIIQAVIVVLALAVAQWLANKARVDADD